MVENRSIWRPDAYTTALDLDREEAHVSHKVAGLGARFVAALIDAVIMAPFVGIGFLLIQAGLQGQPFWVLGITGLTMFVIFTIFFHFFFELITNGQTPGKNSCGLRVVSASGSAATFSQIAIRNLVRPLDWIPAGYVAGAVSALLSPEYQRIGDRLARTVIVYDDSLRQMLAWASIPESVYSTSEDGYLLESFLMRASQLRPEVLGPLARQLAHYFYQKYPPSDASLISAFTQTRYLEFLTQLYDAEKEGALEPEH